MTILLELPYFALAYDPDCACLYATWQGHHNAPSTQASYDLIFWFVRSTGSTKLLNDGLLDQNGWREATNWLAQDCFERLYVEGLTAIAWVLPRDVEASHDTHQLLALLEQPLVATFQDTEAACTWLNQWPKKPMPSSQPLSRH
ncbi:MAG: hypothetical protein EOO60_01870 [Hymenobacter sp.]|nr:MAG: hypothetical protein EOO60_01870 [Hymenobacter sp.]